MLSLIVPTYNERENVRVLYRRTVEALDGEDFEIVFVDDSHDDTPDEIRRLAAEDSRVRLLHRMERGLATAVIDGFRIARGDMLAVIDGDLQHPPEILANLLRVQRETRADLVVPSRYIAGGDPGGLSWPRRVLSLGGRALAHILLRESRATTDPMSGCFIVSRAAAVPILNTRPKGFKILLELMVRGNVQRTVDVPYAFAARDAGQSKLGWKTQADYLRQLLDLVTVNPDNTRFFLFALIGGTGVAVNAALFALMTSGYFDLVPYGALLASLIASHVALLWNFIWNTSITWRDRFRADQIWRHAFRYLVVAEFGALLTALVLLMLRGIGVEFNLLDQLVGILAGVLFTYRLNDRWTFLQHAPALQTERTMRR
ncbi:MAG: glycosyltransferase family 2 protein [Thermaerobacter sp.]|nr:glycosyltransferase family 2 protein [Thermaerobacter sp.]